MNRSLEPEGYEDFLRELKGRIRTAQVQAVLAVNRELILLYWHIGRDILHRQDQAGWGAKVIERLAADLHSEFPEMKGFSRTNLLYMRAFAEAWPEEAFVQQVVGQIPWGHNVRILDHVKDLQEREWYVRATLENGWSRNVLILQIESGLYRRIGKAQTNFPKALPAPQSDLAQQLLKDPYNFDFLTLAKHAQERELEAGLLEHLRKFLLELGIAFVGSQYPLEVGGEDFSLSAIDDLLRHPDDQPTIGLILCKTKNTIVAEYALRDTRKPIGISGFRVTERLPANLQGSLPAIEDLEAQLCYKEEDPKRA